MEIILASDFGRAGHLALDLGWLPQGSHFVTATGQHARMTHPREHWEWTVARGTILRLVLPLPRHALLGAQYVSDMGRCSLVVHD